MGPLRTERNTKNIQIFCLTSSRYSFVFPWEKRRCCSHCRHRCSGSRFAHLSAGLGPEHRRRLERRSDLFPRGASQGALKAPGPAGPSRTHGQILQQASAVDLQAELEPGAGFVAAQEDIVLVKNMGGKMKGDKCQKRSHNSSGSSKQMSVRVRSTVTRSVARTSVPHWSMQKTAQRCSSARSNSRLSIT